VVSVTETTWPVTARTDVARRAVAVAVAVLVVVGCLADAMLESRGHAISGTLSTWLACVVAVGAAGFTVAWARPRNSIGWLLLVSVLLQVVSLVGGSYATAEYASGHPRPGAFLAAFLAEWTWFPSLALPIAVLPSIYPSGRAESRGRRLFAWAGMSGIAGMCVEMGLILGPSDIVPGLQLPYSVPGWLRVVVLFPTVLALAVAILGGLSAAVIRTFRTGPPERQQLIWLLAALVPFFIMYFTSVPAGFLAYALFGAAIAVGVLRYNLLDISVVVQRTLFYVPLIILVALAVAGVSTVVARVAPNGPLPLLGAAVVVAVLVGPVMGWLRRIVDRFVLGARADPVLAVGRVAARGELATRDDPLSSLLEALVEAVGVRYAAVVDNTGQRRAEVGPKTPKTVQFALIEGGDRLGDLEVASPIDTAGNRIVDALVPHVASIVRAQRLVAELETERRRVVEATVAERERIRSDLHDGLGPSLSGISLSLQAVGSAMAGDQPAARAILGRARDEADAAVRDVRRVLEALGPVALDQQPLASAIREAAARLGFDGEAGPAFRCISSDVTTLPVEVEQTAYRIAGEALHNVAQHARAASCEVALSGRGEWLEVHISDDGVGIADLDAVGWAWTRCGGVHWRQVATSPSPRGRVRLGRGRSCMCNSP
jgi:signal transduction histidine kinase